MEFHLWVEADKRVIGVALISLQMYLDAVQIVQSIPIDLVELAADDRLVRLRVEIV